MRRKIRTEITVEHHQVLIIHAPAIEGNIRCSICQMQGLMASAEDTASLLSMTRREVYRAVETGNVHFIETMDGVLFVCIESLLSARSNIRFQEKLLSDSNEIETYS
jgi:hypothetical protein